MRKLLLDTTILVDYFLGVQPACDECCRLVEAVADGRVRLYVSSLACKDVFFLVESSLKRESRMQEGVLSEGAALAAQEIAWACVSNVLEFATVVSVGVDECSEAASLRTLHGDFEDNLMIASAIAANVDYLVTNDARLLGHSPVAALSSKDMLALLGA